MDQIFLTILNMSITATYVMVVVLLLRLLLNRAPKWIAYALWSVVLFRLVSPISFISSFSLLSRFFRSSAITGQVEYIPTDIITIGVPKVDIGIPAFNSLINASLPWSTNPASVNSLQGVIIIGTAVWLAGFAAMLIYSIVSYKRLKRRISSATRISGNVYESDKVESPFVCGFIKPGIYLPVGLSATNQAFVLHHEQTHLKRLDHVIKPLAFLVLAIHWFNPLIWLAFRLMSRDIEMSCDERVVQKLNHDDKANYGEALVQLAMKRPIFSGSPLAFGESGAMGRVRNILNYRKPALWVIIVLVFTLILVGTGLLANPRSASQNYKTYIWQKDFFGSSIYSSIDYQITDEDRANVSAVMSTAEKVFAYTGTKADAEKSVGDLARYYHYSDEIPFSTVKYNLQLITAKVDRSSGYMWVVYSDEQYDQDGKGVSGSANVLSYWEIRKADGKWNVVDIKEHP